MIPLKLVVVALEEHKQRATYGAVAAVTGRPAAFLMAGRPTEARYCWVVNQESLRPTGYDDTDLHPDLFTRDRVLVSGAELVKWLREHGVDVSEELPLVETSQPAPSNAWSNLNTRELLEAYSGVMDALRARGVVRSNNNPVADIAEELARRTFGLQLAAKSAKGFDGIGLEGLRWQVKGRRRTKSNKSTQLGTLRDLVDEQHFDVLLAVYFDERFGVTAAHRITYDCAKEHARYSKSLRGHRLVMTESLRTDIRCEDVTERIRSAAEQFFLSRQDEVQGEIIGARSLGKKARPSKASWKARTSQRDMMRDLMKRIGRDPEGVIAAYAAAERAGHVQRGRNGLGLSAEEYARRVWADGVKKGWLDSA